MKKKTAKKRSAALGNMRNINEKQKQKCVIMHISFVYKGLECLDLQKRNRKQTNDQLKRR